MSDSSTFRQVLSCALEKLAQELEHAHLQALQSQALTELNLPVPRERELVARAPLSKRCQVSGVDDEDQAKEKHAVIIEEVKLEFDERHKTRSEPHCEKRPSATDDPDSPTFVSEVISGDSATQRKLASTASTVAPFDSIQPTLSRSLSEENTVTDPSKMHMPDVEARATWTMPDSPVTTSKRKNRIAQQFTETVQGVEVTKRQWKMSATSFGARLSGPAASSSDSLDEVMPRHSQHAEATHKPKVWKCIIHPFSKGWVFWEACGLVLLTHDIIYLPMQVFDIGESLTVKVIKWITLAYWSLTFLLTFIVSYQESFESTLIVDHKKIIVHYLKGWFAFDFCLVGADWAAIAIELVVGSSEDGLTSTRMARLARLGRLLRTVRILRLMRLGDMLHELQALIDSEYVSICFLIACNVFSILFMSHLSACIWFWFGSIGDESWLVQTQLHTAGIGEQYLDSLGWALSTLLGNDMTQIYPATKAEYVCALVILISGTIAVSLVFSSTTAAMTRLQQLKAGERNAKYTLKNFLKQNNISTSLGARVVRYVDIAKRVHSEMIPSDHVALLQMLSGPLRIELQLELHAPHLMSHVFFESYYLSSPGAMGQLCVTAIGIISLSRYDVLFQTFSRSGHMYCLVSGVMAYRRAKGARNTPATAKVERSRTFCEPALWVWWVHRGHMKALIESQVLQLDAQMFCEITQSHQDVFVQACEYAVAYVLKLNEELEDIGYIWDVPSSLMYPKRGRSGRSGTIVTHDPGYLHMLSEADDITAALMDMESDSDSEDERMLLSTLSSNLPYAGQSHGAASTTIDSPLCAPSAVFV